MIGKRIADGDFPENPGEYSKHSISGETAWFLVLPTGGGTFRLGGPGSGHVVEENADGTITVRPNPPSDPKNTNSILVKQREGEPPWHGYIYDGRWERLPQ